MLAWLLALTLASAPCLGGTNEDAARQHAAALAAARQGELDDAVLRLGRLVRRHPGETLFLHDYISVLQRAGRPRDALDLLSKVDRGRAPAYVLEALGAAACGEGREALCEALYLEVLARFPGREESLSGLAQGIAGRVLAEERVPAGLQRRLATLPAATRAQVLQRAADAVEARDRHYAALHLTLAALQTLPSHQPSQAARIRLATRLGADHLALQLATAQPEAIDDVQLDRLRRQVAAADGRWAGALRALPRQQVHGNALLDAAIARSDAMAARFLNTEDRLNNDEVPWLHDRVVLLSRRGRAREVEALYRRFQQRGLSLPLYAVQAVADAVLSLRQPRRAIPLYEQVLRDEPDNPEARVGMYYALLESEQHECAYAWVDRWVKDTAPPADARTSAAARATHWSARTLQARAREYSGEPARAQSALESLREQAPANPEVRAGLASVYRARGWPRRAWETWQLQLLQDPWDVDAHAESVASLLDSFRFEQAQSALRAAQQRDAEAVSVTRATRAWQLHNRPQLLITADAGRSSDAGAPSGGHDHHVDAVLYSPPFGERYRAFLHATDVAGNPAGTGTQLRRAGAGLEYRGPDLRLAARWHRGWRDDGGNGLRLDATWWYDDVFSASLEGDTRAADVPLQAARAGIDLRRAAVELNARLSESRALGARLSAGEFSDGNQRLSAQLDWREQWWTRPRHWLTSHLELYTSHNSHEGAPYFNPRSDYSASLSVTAAWRTWRWYERDFVQELTLSGGRYWQSDFASGPLWGIEYAHRWDLDERLYLRYGVGRTLRPYDGAQSGRGYLVLDLDWRF